MASLQVTVHFIQLIGILEILLVIFIIAFFVVTIEICLKKKITSKHVKYKVQLANYQLPKNFVKDLVVKRVKSTNSSKLHTVATVDLFSSTYK